MNNIHSTAVTSKNSELEGVTVEPYVRIGENVIIKKGTKICKGAIIEDYTEIGENCLIGPYAIIGGIPADYHFKNEYSKVILKEGVKIREFVSIHRATGNGNATIVGKNSYIMAYVHIGHNSKIGEEVVIANNTQLGGYTVINNFAFIGGMTGIHQFTRVGDYAMIGAFSYLTQDVPPFLLAAGNPLKIYGVNVVGLQRRGFSQKRIENIKRAFKILYSNLGMEARLQKLKSMEDEDIALLLNFIKISKRGIRLKREL